MTCACALQKVELRRVVGLTVFGQIETELPKLGTRVREKAVEGVVEHRRDQLPHDQYSVVSGGLGTLSQGNVPLGSLSGRECHLSDPKSR